MAVVKVARRGKKPSAFEAILVTFGVDEEENAIRSEIEGFKYSESRPSGRLA